MKKHDKLIANAVRYAETMPDMQARDILIDLVAALKGIIGDENQVQSICMDHVLSIDQGFSDALATVRNRFFETKQAVYEREDDDQMLPVTIILDVSVAPDLILRNQDKE